MQIVRFEDLTDPHDFLELMEACFGEIAQPEHAGLIRRWDERRRESFGYGMYVGRRLAGFIGVMDQPVRTLRGSVENVLGIHHVATHPSFARQGIARRLFDHVHRLYREKGCRFSFLFTSRILVAYRLYCRLGYQDIPVMGRSAPRAELILPRGRVVRRNSTAASDLGRIEGLFAEWSAGRAGFAVRAPGWPLARIRQWKLKPGDVFVDRDGYAFTQPDHYGRWIVEFLARSRASYRRILDRVVAAGPKALVDFYAWDPVLRKVYADRGFRFRRDSYATLMARPLGRASVRATFGPRFFFTVVDQF